MENLYKKTNYSSAPGLGDCDPECLEGLQLSNSLYDENRLITHAFVDERDEDGVCCKRLVNDVELAFSNAPEIRAIVSDEYQRNLRDRILNQPKSPSKPKVSDDDLISSVVPSGLEPDEAAGLAYSRYSSMPSDEKVDNPAPPTSDNPVSPTSDNLESPNQ